MFLTRHVNQALRDFIKQRSVTWVLLFLACAKPMLSSAATNYIAQFQTLDSSFSPTVECAVAQPQLFQWTWSDKTICTNYPDASKYFGTAGSRMQYLTVSPASDVTKINVGFDGSDGGWTNVYAFQPNQGVGAVYFMHPLTNLQYWASSYNPITNKLDFTGFTALQNVECWHCSNLQHVAVANLPSLRRVCFEQCDLQELDLSGNPNLEDVRGALNGYRSITLGGGTGPKIWHWCLRDNPQITQDFQAILTNFYSLREPWFWNANQSGALKFVSTNLTDVEVFGNAYTSADFTGQSNMFYCLINDNALTNLSVSGCRSLQTLDAHLNYLPTSVLDSLLRELDTADPSLTYVDLTQNEENPSYIGYAHYSALTNRGVTVLIDFPSTNFTWPVVTIDSTALVSESCPPGNGSIDPNETVAVSFSLRNKGTRDTANLVVTLLETNGVVAPSPAQKYGALLAGGAGANGLFTFTATGVCGGHINPTLHLQDGTQDLGTLEIRLQLGHPVAVFTADFDSVAPPELPAGWSTGSSGSQVDWVTDNSLADTIPNAAFVFDSPDIGLAQLVSPSVQVPPGPSLLTFQNDCDLEFAPDPLTAFDGGVLEIQIGTNDFQDIVAAGGSFLSGGYNRKISSDFENPLAGRFAWCGPQSGFVTTTVSLPTSALGRTIRLRWVCGTDSGNGVTAGLGWRIDSIAITASKCCGPASPPPTAPEIRFINESAGLFTISWRAVPGTTYRLQFKRNLNDPAWTDLGADITATSTTTSVTDSVAPTGQRFYRIFALP